MVNHETWTFFTNNNGGYQGFSYWHSMDTGHDGILKGQSGNVMGI
jgi:hypothetical protein